MVLTYNCPNEFIEKTISVENLPEAFRVAEINKEIYIMDNDSFNKAMKIRWEKTHDILGELLDSLNMSRNFSTYMPKSFEDCKSLEQSGYGSGSLYCKSRQSTTNSDKCKACLSATYLSD